MDKFIILCNEVLIIMEYNNKIIKLIIDYIYSNEQLNNIFNQYTQKYTLPELILSLTKILYNNI